MPLSSPTDQRLHVFKWQHVSGRGLSSNFTSKLPKNSWLTVNVAELTKFQPLQQLVFQKGFILVSHSGGRGGRRKNQKIKTQEQNIQILKGFF